MPVVPARRGRAVRLNQGQALRITNTHGHQVVDFWAFSAEDMAEFLSMEHLRATLTSIFPKAGCDLVTNRRRPILHFAEDTSPGIHDTIMAACDRHRYVVLGVEGYHRNCQDNMFEGMLELGATPHFPIPGSWNVFMNIPVKEDGYSIDILPTVCEPGQYIVTGKGLQVTGNNNIITGDGVFFFNTDTANDGNFGAVMFTGGGSEVTFTATTATTNGSGPAHVDPAYYGVLFFGDRSMGDQEFRTNGGVITNFDGAVYWPSGTINHSGNSSNTHTCTGKLIGNKINFAGTSDSYYKGGNCAADQVNISRLAKRVSLVE